MSELPPDLPRLRTLETWLSVSLARVRAKIAEVEQREAAMRTVRPEPAGPGLVLTHLREGGRPVPDSVHLSDCALAGKRTTPLGHDEARRVLAEGRISACPICRPDSALGLLG